MSSEKGWRGGEQQIAYLLDDLSRMNVRNVLAVKGGSVLEKFAHEKGISCNTVRYSSSVDVISAYKINKICRREGIDLIHLHSSKAHGVGVLGWLYGNKIPMVLSRRVAFLPGGNILSKWKYNHRQIKKILCVSHKIKTIMQRYVMDESKCVTVYSGIDLKKFDSLKADRDFLLREFNMDPQKTIVTAIGAIDDSKDHFTFVETIEKLLAFGNRVHGLIIGDGPLAESLKNFIRHRQMSDNITVAGYRKDAGLILISSDIFLMTSREEGLGTSLLDAFLAGVPVVATDAGGIPEIVRHGETGLLASVRDSRKLAENISRLLTEKGLRERLVERAAVFVRNFSKEETSAKTFSIYRDVLSNAV